MAKGVILKTKIQDPAPNTMNLDPQHKYICIPVPYSVQCTVHTVHPAFFSSVNLGGGDGGWGGGGCIIS